MSPPKSDAERARAYRHRKKVRQKNAGTIQKTVEVVPFLAPAIARIASVLNASVAPIPFEEASLDLPSGAAALAAEEERLRCELAHLLLDAYMVIIRLDAVDVTKEDLSVQDEAIRRRINAVENVTAGMPDTTI